MRQLRDQIRGGRRDHEDLILLRQADMFDCARERVLRARAGKQVGMDLAAGERGEGERTNEFLCRGCQNDVHGESAFHQGASQLGGLIGRDASTDAERYIHREIGHRKIGPCRTAVGRPAVKKPTLFLGHDLQVTFQVDIRILHQTTTHFFHGRRGRLLRCRGQQAACAILQLAGALGGHDDEPVNAGFRIVRNHAVRSLPYIVAVSHFNLSFSSRPRRKIYVQRTRFIDYLEKRFLLRNVSRIGRIESSILSRRLRVALTIDTSVSTDAATSWFTST